MSTFYYQSHHVYASDIECAIYDAIKYDIFNPYEFCKQNSKGWEISRFEDVVLIQTGDSKHLFKVNLSLKKEKLSAKISIYLSPKEAFFAAKSYSEGAGCDVNVARIIQSAINELNNKISITKKESQLYYEITIHRPEFLKNKLTKFQVNRLDSIENNQRFYFTGEKCKNGHVTYLNTSSGECAACNQRYYQYLSPRLEYIRKIGIDNITGVKVHMDDVWVIAREEEKLRRVPIQHTTICPWTIDNEEKSLYVKYFNPLAYNNLDLGCPHEKKRVYNKLECLKKSTLFDDKEDISVWEEEVIGFSEVEIEEKISSIIASMNVDRNKGKLPSCYASLLKEDKPEPSILWKFKIDTLIH